MKMENMRQLSLYKKIYFNGKISSMKNQPHLACNNPLTLQLWHELFEKYPQPSIFLTTLGNNCLGNINVWELEMSSVRKSHHSWTLTKQICHLSIHPWPPLHNDWHGKQKKHGLIIHTVTVVYTLLTKVYQICQCMVFTQWNTHCHRKPWLFILLSQTLFICWASWHQGTICRRDDYVSV